MAGEQYPLCRLADIADGGSAAFEPVIDGRPRRLMTIRGGERVLVYENTCPHLGWPLDIVPGRFLDAAGRHILCTNHGALFRVEDGVCVKGPCIGAALEQVPSEVKDGLVAILLQTGLTES
jgi:nitrite reductase/ring-hydroxylating ferredoxin subunit